MRFGIIHEGKGVCQYGEIRLCGENHRDYEDALVKIAEESMVYRDTEDGSVIAHYDEWESFLNYMGDVADDYNDGKPSDLDGLVEPGDYLMVPFVVYGEVR